MSLLQRIDGFQQRHAVVGFPLAVVYKFTDDQGSNLAALIAYYAFVSLFPLLLALTTILGLVLSGHAHLQQQVLDSAVGQFPALGQDLRTPGKLGGGTVGLVIGLVGALYGGLGVAGALQNAMNSAWTVPRNSRPNPLKARLLSLRLLATIGLAILATTAVAAVANGAGGLADQFGALLRIGVLLLAVGLNALVFSVAFRIATVRSLTAGEVLPGALSAAVAWQVLQSFGASYVSHVSGSSTATSGVFGIVLGLIAFLYLAAVVVVLCVEINVVRVNRLYPRSLLTPFTDAVTLTPGDEDAYTRLAQAQRAKGFESVEVSFDPHGDADG